MAKEELQWLTVDDFSAGIVSSLATARGKYVPSINPGAASANGTFRCVPLPSGGLGPGPRRDYSLARGSMPGPGARWYFNGFYVTGPINIGTGTTRSHEFFMSYEIADGTRRYRLERYVPFTPPQLDQNLITWDSPTSFAALNQYITTKFATTISNTPNPYEAGRPSVVIAHNAPGPLNPARIAIFPDEYNPSNSGVGQLYTDQFHPGLMFGHQHRIVWCDARNFVHGDGNIAAWLNNEYVFFTDLNAAGQLVNYDPVMFSPENPSGYGTAASLTANELLLIKQRGGGVMIRGDLNRPTVYTMPNLASSDRVEGAKTKRGFIYAGDDGNAHVWAGGDTTTNISEHLHSQFYVPADDPRVFLDTRAVWAAWGTNYMVTSNLYLLDLDGMGWWRLDDPADLRQGVWNMQAGSSRFLYAATHSFTDGDDEIVYGWDQRTPAKTWSWESHPYRPGLDDREMTIRQVLIRAQGKGTITWTPHLLDGSTGQPETIELNNVDFPVVARLNVHVPQQFIHARIEAAGDGDGGAPVLHSISYGLDAAHQIPTTHQGA